MKLILLDNKEFRIDTLRKVFGVDKYKIMRANAELFIKELRQQQRELAVKGEGLGEKEKQQENYLKEISLLDEQIKHASSKKEDAEASLQKVLSLQKEIDEKIKQVAELKNKQASLDTALKSSVELFQSLTLQSKALQDQCQPLDDQLKKHQEIDSAALEKKKSLTQQEIQENERKLFSIVKNINETAVKKEQAQSIKNKIRQLDKCLTCLQQVSENHKSIIMEREDKQISQQEKIISENKQLQLENEKKTGSLKKLLLEIQDREKASEINLINKKNLEEKKQGLKKLELEQDELKKRIGLINADKAETAKNLALQSAIENEHREIRTKVDQAQHGKHSIELQLNGFLKEKQGIQRMLENVEDEIKLKKESLENLKKLGHYEEWLETMFLNLMIEIEKHVMGKLYHEFNELFQRWFKLLMEDETITVHLDGEFAPVITQNGYEVGIEYLSGGEKTSCALSYRLSLNQVINDLLGTVKTKDLIILDEPTDGFSTEQLDKIRDLLQQIQMKQIIIVSHEKKIESFVDHVVQVRKQDHVSEVSVSG
jgi:exonuclease SbcC